VLPKWPIRVKLLAGFGLLLGIVAILSSDGLYTTYTYRTLVKSLSWRVTELPVAAELSNHVADLRVTLSELRGLRARDYPSARADFLPIRMRVTREQFRVQLDAVDDTLAEYELQLDHKVRSVSMADNQPEWETARKIKTTLEEIRATNRDRDWMLDEMKVDQLEGNLDRLQALACELPSHLHSKLAGFAAEVRGQYRLLIIGIWVTSVSAALLFALFVRLFFRWIIRPLQTLIHGSREVATGNFSFRTHLDTHDEMAELAKAMNDMTTRFQDIRDDLDRQVQERTKQVVRNEQLASVGFLAAGVAHEINNPLASIALCAESLESRIRELLQTASRPAESDETGVIMHYLGMIQSEAFRCKGITEKLLDFSRMGPAQRQETELRELVEGVIDMIGHVGKYHQRHVELAPGGPVRASVNVQEIKQVVLNLLTNALESIEEQGAVRVELTARDRMAVLTVSDDGCGMETTVLERVFEPFFTRRKAGQGTGLGLSISHRIVADHDGTIEARSDGPGRGATFRVQLPLSLSAGQSGARYAA
jgi:two-component system, NtrC family, sensor kinase